MLATRGRRQASPHHDSLQAGSVRLLPRDEEFFDLFDKSAARIVEAARDYRSLLDSPAQFRENARRLKELEHQTDEITHATLAKLYKTFVTPLDREDIHALITRLDDVIDYIDAAAQRFVMFQVEVVPDDMPKQVDLLTMATQELQGAVQGLRTLKKTRKIQEHLIELNRLENEGDLLFRIAIGRLFANATDPIRLMVWKELYEITEEALDRCEGVAHVIEAVVLKHG
jgi:predicted phosphate transport protein (TIGR00153 family)